MLQQQWIPAFAGMTSLKASGIRLRVPIGSGLVNAGIAADDPTAKVLNQVFLGDQNFVEWVTRHLQSPPKEVPKRQRQWISLASLLGSEKDRDSAIALAYRTGRFMLTEIGQHVGPHHSTESKIARRSV